MIFSFCLALARADEEVLGTYSRYREFLPLVPKTSVDGRALFLDYENNRIGIANVLPRFVSTFRSYRAEPYMLSDVFGHFIDPKTNEFVLNFSTITNGGPITKDQEASYTHYMTSDHGGLETGKFLVDIYAQVRDETGQNYSILIFNESCDFYEVTDYKETALTIFIYITFIAVVGAILYVIFTKQNIADVVTAKKDKKKPKKQIRDYADVHNVSDRSSSPGTGSGKGARKNSPGSRSSGSGKAKKN